LHSTPSFTTSASNKPIKWLPLPRLHTDDWEREAAVTDRLLAQLIAMCAGHPRSIEYVRAERPNVNRDDVGDLLRTIAGRFGGSGVDFNLTWSFLAPAFTGVALRPDERSGTATLAQAVAGGALQNALEDASSALKALVPQPSLFILYAHAVDLLSSDDANVRALCVKKIVRLVTAPVTGFSFETLHAHWHALVVHLYAPSQQPGVRQSVLLCGKTNSGLYRNAVVYVGGDVNIDCNVPSPKVPVLKVVEDISKPTLLEWHVEDDVLVVVRQLTPNQVVLPGATNNAGFDMLVLHQTTDGKPHLLIIECKFSKADAQNALSWYQRSHAKDGVQHKVEKVRDYLHAVFASSGSGEHVIKKSGVVSADQVTLLIVANRDVVGTFAHDANVWLRSETTRVGFNVGVVTRDNLLARYGRALSSAVAFNI
jgi:hypothetical protein